MRQIFQLTLAILLLLGSNVLRFEKSSMAQSGDDFAARLEGLDFDEFLEVSFRELMLRYPERILEYGLTETYGVETVELNNLSDSYVQETYQMVAIMLDVLHGYNQEELTPEQQISSVLYEWYLGELVYEGEFLYYQYPVNSFFTSTHTATQIFFTEIHPLANRQDAEDYITRLRLVDTKFEQLIESLQIREEMGVIPPRFVIDKTLGDMYNLTSSNAQYNPFFTGFRDKVNALDELTDAEKESLVNEAMQAVEESVIPAYVALQEYLYHLRTSAPADAGLLQFPGGDDYYAYLVRHNINSDMTPQQVHDLGLQELSRIHAEMRAIFDELGYPEDESLLNLFQRVEREGGVIPASEAIETYETIIGEAWQNLEGVFETFPRTELVVMPASASGGSNYYTPGSDDGSRPGIFFAYIAGDRPYYRTPTIIYHESIPGHHFQLSVAREQDFPTFRRLIPEGVFTAFEEGWALYAEQLAWELGWYEDDPYGYLGYLQYQALRAVRLVADTGIHSRGWTFDETADFFVENTGLPPGFAEYSIHRYVSVPGQALSYMAGMLKILELRQRAMDELGDNFDLAEFHRVVLSNGSISLYVLEQVVDDYISDKLAASASPSS